MAHQVAEGEHVAGVLLVVEARERRAERVDVAVDPGPVGEPADDAPDHAVVAEPAALQVALRWDDVVVPLIGAIELGQVNQLRELVRHGLPDDLSALLAEPHPPAVAIVVR